ncbi:hypothetical protein [Nocardia salmonicida]|uniref:hypothetical protein n=1 Tax=Nocardia salmonicida TaxID=53431 RepID=UPI0033F8B217
MFMTSDNNSGPTSGPSTEDEITRDTGRAMGQIMAAARAFIASRRGRQRKAKMPKLSRKERRELVETLRTQVGEQRMAQVWSTKRVGDYHAEVVAANDRRRNPAYPATAARADDERLNRIRYSIEATTHASPLSVEQRGQVAIAMSQVERRPDRPLGEVFRPMNTEQERNARAAAVQSETWVQEHREANERALVEQRHREQARRNAAPPVAWENMTAAQQEAVQQLRGAELALRRPASVGNADTRAKRDQEMRAAARQVRAAGLPLRQVAHERDNIVANSQFEVTVYGPPTVPGSLSWHPTEAAALRYTEKAVADMPVWDGGMNVRIAPRSGTEAARAGETNRSLEGEYGFAADTVGRWRRDHEDGTVSAMAPGTGFETGIEVSAADPLTGRVLRSESVVLRTDEVNATDIAHRAVAASRWTDEEVRVEIYDAAVDFDYDRDTALYRESGSPKFVESELVAERVALRELATTDARAATARAVTDRDSLQQRHNLSIEHNADLTDRNAELTRQLTAMTAQRDQLRGERDEAVRKVIERTPPAERFGSPERQAEQAKRSALADHAPGNAVAAAFARTAERDEAER